GAKGTCAGTDSTQANYAGAACASGQVCGGGVCAVSCPGSEINCGGTCVDPTTSNTYCGATAGCGATGGTAGTNCANAFGACVASACQPLATPAPTFLWLDATDATTLTLGAGNTVTTWRDKTGLGGRDAIANPQAPIWTANVTPNGQPAVRFNPTQQRLVTPGVTSASEMTIFIVFDMINPQTWACLFEQLHDTYFSVRKSDCCGGGGNLNFHIQNDNAAPLIPITTNTWKIVTALRQGTTSTISYRGGPSASFTGDTLTGGQTAPLYIGSSTVNESSGAYIAEIRAYSSALSAAQRSGIETVLASKYGL
ncbi:MAG: LamG-like jellyroll fold domain-containing protein, partial [Ktedonobacterales bacterium]